MAQFREPQPRRAACGATVGDNFFVYRGWHSSFRGMRTFPRISNIEEFNTTSLEWVERETSGSSPPGLWQSASAATSQHLYHFGGGDGKMFTNVLSELNISSRNWRKIHPVNPSEGPMRKGTCGMISINDEMLCITCGFGIPDGRTPINSRFVKSTKFTDGRGWSNELHLFNMKTALWSSPPSTGQGPPPCSACSFTRVNKKKAVMFGGYQPEVKKYVADTYILNFETWHWTALLQQASSQPWPVGRVYHTAFSLYDPDSNPPHPCLAVACGLATGDTPLNDLWVLSVEEQYWEEVPLPDSFPPRWRHTGGVVHKSQTQVRTTFFGGIPDSPRMYASWKEWPCMAQTTVIDLELDLTEMKRGESTGWVAVSVKDSTAIATLKATQIYEEALQYGHVESRALLCLLTGVAGSGKTHVGYLMFGKKPPTLRESTPLATAPVRALSLAKVHASEEEEEDEWHEVDDEEQSQMIADNLAAGVSLESKRDEPTPEQPTPDSPAVESSSSPNGLSGITPDPSKEASILANSSTERQENSPTISQQESRLQSQQAQSQQDLYTSQRQQPVVTMEDRLIKMISKSSGSRKLSDVKWIYLLDSGGQPQFHDMLPLLLRARPLTIFVTKLNERLNQRPLIEYYEKGKRLGTPYPSPLSHKEVLQHSLRAILSQAHLQHVIEQPANVPQLIIVGTHRDLERKCSETRAEKNAMLVSLLTPSLSKNLVYHGQEMKEPIFPVNAKKPQREDHQIAKALRRAILKAAASLEAQKIPIAWYLLEQALRRMAKELGRSILTHKEGLQVADRLRVSKSGFTAALDHLSLLNVIMYLKDVLPNIIFVSPQVVLDKMSEPVQHSFKLRGLQSTKEVTSGKWLRFRNEGMVTLEILQEFPKHYVYKGDLFTPHHMIQLMQHNLLAAEVAEGEYLMPSILPELTAEEVDKHRVQPSSTVAPLTISFSDGVVPAGLFCSLMASLLSPQSPHHCELLRKASPTHPNEPECVARNCIKFQLTQHMPGSLVVIDSYSHIEVHLNTPVEADPSVVCGIRMNILDHIKKAACSLHYRSMEPEIALLCESEDHEDKGIEPQTLPWWKQLFGDKSPKTNTAPPHTATPHTATFPPSGNAKWWRCSLSPEKVYGRMEDRHSIWFTPLHETSDREGVHMEDPEMMSTVAGHSNPNADASSSHLHATEEHPLEVDQSEDLHMNRTASIFCNPEQKEPPHPLDLTEEHPLDVDHSEGKHVNQTSTILELPPHPHCAQPSLRELIAFPGKKTILNIPAEVGTKYFQFGLLLLEDDTGAKVSSIEHQHQRDAERINLEILREWLSGRGLQPVAWETLCNVLDCVGLSTLASDIRSRW